MGFVTRGNLRYQHFAQVEGNAAWSMRARGESEGEPEENDATGCGFVDENVPAHLHLEVIAYM